MLHDVDFDGSFVVNDKAAVLVLLLMECCRCRLDDCTAPPRNWSTSYRELVRLVCKQSP